MKIAICGTQCVGKSTFIEDILSEMPEFKRPTFTYRDAIAKAGIGHKINRKTCSDSQRLIFNAVTKEIESSTPYTIHDRAILDVVAYTIWPTKFEKDTTDITAKDIRNMKKTAIDIMEMYDLIVYIPLDDSIPIEDDQFRDVDPNYRRQMAKIMDSLYVLKIDDPKFDKYGYKTLIIEGTRSERVAAFKNHIKAIA
jgi:GTPase SAR1 family protein